MALVKSKLNGRELGLASIFIEEVVQVNSVDHGLSWGEEGIVGIYNRLAQDSHTGLVLVYHQKAGDTAIPVVHLLEVKGVPGV